MFKWSVILSLLLSHFLSQQFYHILFTFLLFLDFHSSILFHGFYAILFALN